MNACLVSCDWLRACWLVALCLGLILGALSRPHAARSAVQAVATQPGR